VRDFYRMNCMLVWWVNGTFLAVAKKLSLNLTDVCQNVGHFLSHCIPYWNCQNSIKRSCSSSRENFSTGIRFVLPCCMKSWNWVLRNFAGKANMSVGNRNILGFGSFFKVYVPSSLDAWQAGIARFSMHLR